MELYLKYIETKFNNGLGFLPVSTFVELTQYTDKAIRDMNTLYEFIKKIECRDVIFFGDIFSNEEALEWLIAKLLSDLFYVSIMITLPQKIPEIICRRMIVRTDLQNLKKHIDKLSILRDMDILLLDSNDVKELRGMRTMIYNNELKCRIMATGNIVEEDIISMKIFDLPLVKEV